MCWNCECWRQQCRKQDTVGCHHWWNKLSKIGWVLAGEVRIDALHTLLSRIYWTVLMVNFSQVESMVGHFYITQSNMTRYCIHQWPLLWLGQNMEQRLNSQKTPIRVRYPYGVFIESVWEKVYHVKTAPNVFSLKQHKDPGLTSSVHWCSIRCFQ